MFVLQALRAGQGKANSFATRNELSLDLADLSDATADQELVTPKPVEGWRLRLFFALEDPSSSKTAKAVSFFILATITVSIINFMVASYPSDLCGYATLNGVTKRVCSGTRLTEDEATQVVETVCILIFTAEYLLRLFVCTAVTSRARFLVDPLNILDVLAIMPWYVDIIVTAVADNNGSGGGILGVLRIVRLTRVLRVFKASKSTQSMIVLVRTLKRSFSAFMILLSSILVTMLLFGSFIVFFERGTYVEQKKQYLRRDASASPFLSIPHCMYWCMTSMTTVGYGDMFPITGIGQVIAMIAMVCGIVVLSVPITVIGANFDEETREQHRINQLRKRVLTLEKLRVKGVISDTEVNGLQEIGCLLEDHRNSVLNDVEMMVSKSEPTFTHLVRKVLIQSRAFTSDGPTVAQTGTVGHPFDSPNHVADLGVMRLSGVLRTQLQQV